MKRLFAVIFFVLAVFTISGAQTQARLELDNSSSLTIFGSTNISKFKLVLPGDKFPGKSFSFTYQQNQNKISLCQNRLALEVNNFTSNNRIALNGFLKLIKSKTYPVLDIQLNNLEIISPVPGSNSINGKAFLNVTITGVTKQYQIPFSSRLENGMQYADGKMRISIRDFGLIPPVEMMGMVKTSEWIEINLHIVARISL
ncbi:MAG: YceI family protein [Bacteroidales bacterium]|nr:YceI family protein [Bacteroidales bacterium]